MAYAIISLGGKQYRVQEGERLLVDRVPTEEGKTFHPEVLMLGAATELVSFPPEIAEVYFVSSIPFVTRPIDLLTISVFSLVVCFIATIIPSARAARLNPVDALRHE